MDIAEICTVSNRLECKKKEGKTASVPWLAFYFHTTDALLVPASFGL